MIKTCKLCGKQFESTSGRKTICDDKHYTKCVICGKQIEIKYKDYIPKTCSTECRMKLKDQTCLEKYGTRDPGNSEAAKEKRRQTNLSRYGVDNPSKSKEVVNKIKDTWIAKYGVENVSQLDSHKKQVTEAWKNKSSSELSEIQNKRINTSRERWGVDNPRQNEEISEKIKQTVIERYGVDCPLKNPEVRNKANKTLIERWGTLYPTQLQVIQDKTVKTCQMRYGVDRYQQTDECKQRFKDYFLEKYGVDNPAKVDEFVEKRIKTNQDRYGVSAAFLLPEYQDKMIEGMRNSSHSRISSVNRKFSELLASLGIHNELEFRLENRFFDICIPDSRILVEIDPSWTHSTHPTIFDGVPADYHRMKTQLAEKHGYRCIHVFDWDSTDKIISLIKHDETIFARNCTIDYVSADVADRFLNLNHIQGTVSHQIVCIGLFYENRLVEIMTFGTPRYSSKYQWELLRLCFELGSNVVGGASRLFKRFIDDMNPESIISYCNRAKFKGDVYTKLGFKYVRTNSPTKWWSKASRVISDTLLRQRGYDQLFGTNYGKGTSNEQLMIDNWWLPVYDCGQAVYELNLTKADLR